MTLISHATAVNVRALKASKQRTETQFDSLNISSILVAAGTDSNISSFSLIQITFFVISPFCFYLSFCNFSSSSSCTLCFAAPRVSYWVNNTLARLWNIDYRNFMLLLYVYCGISGVVTKLSIRYLPFSIFNLYLEYS